MFSDAGEGPELAERVRQAQAGNAEALASLLREYQPGAQRAIHRVTGHAGLWDDAWQETTLAVWRGIRQLAEPEKFPGWLMEIARRQTLRLVQKERREREIAHQMPCELVRMSQAWSADWLSDGVQSLPHEFALPATLHYLEGWPVQRIAASLELTETTVKWRLHRARQLLRQKFTINGEGPQGNS